MTKTQCEKCQSRNVRPNGNDLKLKCKIYICKDCGYSWREKYNPIIKQKKKAKTIILFLLGYTNKDISKIVGIGEKTIGKWIKKYGGNLDKLRLSIVQIEKLPSDEISERGDGNTVKTYIKNGGLMFRNDVLKGKSEKFKKYGNLFKL